MPFTRLGRQTLLAAAIVLPPPFPAIAQTLKGTILGTVTDASHAVVPGVVVKATEVNTSFHRSETSNESGFFAFANLDPGTYRVDVEHPGFRKLVRSGITLEANTTFRSDLELAPGDVTQVVDVTSEAPVLQTDRTDTGARIDTQDLANLPMLNNRNYQNTLMTIPGVQRTYRSNSPFFNSQEHLQSVVNGLDQMNNYMIEGHRQQRRGIPDWCGLARGRHRFRECQHDELRSGVRAGRRRGRERDHENGYDRLPRVSF